MCVCVCGSETPSEMEPALSSSRDMKSLQALVVFLASHSVPSLALAARLVACCLQPSSPAPSF